MAVSENESILRDIILSLMWDFNTLLRGGLKIHIERLILKKYNHPRLMNEDYHPNYD